MCFVRRRTLSRGGVFHLSADIPCCCMTLEIKGYFVLKCSKAYGLLYIVCWGGDHGKGKA